MTRAEKLKLIWRHTHSDFKGKTDGIKTVMIYRNGTCLVALDGLTDAEIEKSLPYALHCEAKRKEKRS